MGTVANMVLADESHDPAVDAAAGLGPAGALRGGPLRRDRAGIAGWRTIWWRCVASRDIAERTASTKQRNDDIVVAGSARIRSSHPPRGGPGGESAHQPRTRVVMRSGLSCGMPPARSSHHINTVRAVRAWSFAVLRAVLFRAPPVAAPPANHPDSVSRDRLVPPWPAPTIDSFGGRGGC